MIDTIYGFQKCLVCDNGKPIYSPYGGRGIFICDDCIKYLHERKMSHKSNWIAGSKGGEPNCRRG